MTKRQQSVPAGKPASLLPLTGFLRLSGEIHLLTVRPKGHLEQKQANLLLCQRVDRVLLCTPPQHTVLSSSTDEHENQWDDTVPTILGLPDPVNKGRDVKLMNREASMKRFYKGSQHSMLSPTRTEVTEWGRKLSHQEILLGQTDCKSQRTGEFAVRLCLLAKVRGYTHKVCSAWLPQQEPNRDNSNHYAKVDGERTTGPQPSQL